MPIRLRLALAFAAITLVILACAGFLFLRSFRHGLESSLDTSLRAQASALAREARRGVDTLDLHTVASGLPTNDAVAQVLDADGRVVTATREAGTAPVIDPARVRRARADTTEGRILVGREHEPYRALVRVVGDDAGTRVVVATSLESTDNAVSRVRNGLLVGSALAVVLAGVGAWFLAGAALGPVERMRRQASLISEHDPAGRLPVPGTRDEISSLAATINDLLARLQDAMARQRAFVADASHELRTPLAVLSTELELAGRPGRTYAELVDSLQHATAETQRLRHLADELLFLARHDDDPGRRADDAAPLLPVVQEAVASRRVEAVGRDVDLRLRASCVDLPVVTVDRASFRRAVDNVIENALRFAPTGSTVVVDVAAEDDEVVVTVLDEGVGFPPDFVTHAFERFRRADDARARADGGAGLGLAIVEAVAERHRGRAVAVNRPEGGAAVSLHLPAPRA
jgi:two-component system OmpR family sensor kinase